MAARTTSIAVGHKVSTDELRQRGADRALDEYYKLLGEYDPVNGRSQENPLWLLANHTIFTSAISLPGLVGGFGRVADICRPWLQHGAVALIPFLFFCIFRAPVPGGFSLLPGPKLALILLLTLLWVIVSGPGAEAQAPSVSPEQLRKWYAGRAPPSPAATKTQQDLESVCSEVRELESEVYGIDHANSANLSCLEDCAFRLSTLAVETGLATEVDHRWVKGAKYKDIWSLAKRIHGALGA